MQYREYRVEKRESGKRLREYLAAKLEISGRRAKALLDARVIIVNGQRVWMAAHELKMGDRVSVPSATPDAPPPTTPLPVLCEDADYLVIDKPAGMEANGEGSAEERVRATLGDPQIAAAHRLDRDTTGCLLFARHPKAYEAVVEVFREHRVTKEYRAIVTGRVRMRQQTIDTALDGLHAVTHVRVLASSDAASYLLVHTMTGRTHQIRRHLAGIHHPILGDRQHGPQRRLDRALMEVPRQMLHASRLRLTSPVSQREIQAHSRLPADFRRCLSVFGLKD